MAHVRKRLTKKTVLIMTGFNEAALDAAVEQGAFPAPVYVGKRSLWLAFDVVDWLMDNVISPAYLRKRLLSK